ncbi:MAG: DNA polymerase/3'-5' exonuclease PolX [Methanotrichaceae archaeon]|nr:DNA polymerase/3'-5' exonuclease PolX [Methanotrichaceae archaeon]
MKNREVAKILYDMAELLELKAENRFKIIAYGRAARAIEGLKEDIVVICRKGQLESVPGVGKAIAQKIEEYLRTGKIQAHQGLLRETPAGLAELLQIPGLGPKTIYMLHDRLGIKDLDELEKAALDHHIRRLPRMGAASERNILRAIERYKKRSTRILLSNAEPIVEEIVEYLKGIEGLEHITPAGSLRRGKETVGDIDILATASKSDEVIKAFIRMPIVEEVLSKGSTKASVIVQETVQVDLRIVEHKSYGTVLQYFTGSKEHNVKLRQIALDRGYSLSEYSLKRLSDGQDHFFDWEEDLYHILGMQYIPPELREDSGEIEAAFLGRLPELVDLKDIRGDLHVHSEWSDGRGTLEALALEAKNLGYEYIAVSDHSPSIGIAGGLQGDQLERKIEAIHAINETIEGITLLVGTEVDIKADGKLDYRDELLEKCDVVVASVHMAQRQKERAITGRLITAIENDHVDIIGHPSGRIIGKRDPYDVDMQAVLESAASTGTAMEINSYPNRLDLNDVWAKTAKEFGVKIAINSDAHDPSQLKVIRYGVKVARRGWLEKKDVLNSLSLQGLFSYLKH